MESYKEKDIEDSNELAHYRGVYYPTVVNYCNILSSIGRLSKAIYTIRPVADEGFGMAKGNLGIELLDYTYFDYNNDNQQIILNIVEDLLVEAIHDSHESVHPFAKEHFRKRLDELLSNEDACCEVNNSKSDSDKVLETQQDKDDNVLIYKDGEEDDYRRWISNNCLTLNTLNEAIDLEWVGYDPLHLPGMISNIEEKGQRYHGLFNQIKQEYCSARYLLYEGMFNHQAHFSDSKVYLVNTFDYPVYGINIEKIKSSYRTVYSLFDRIAFFLNEYFSLNINERKVSFGRVWGKESKLHDIAETNYPLGALKWIKKDLYSNSVSEYNEYIDPLLSRTYVVRNVMEHRYLKVVNYEIDINNDKSEHDPVAFTISLEEFHDLAINLLRTSREAIILTAMAINVEEKRKREKLGDKFIPILPLTSYEDEWKF